MGLVFSNGLMEPNTKDTGASTKLREKVLSGTQKVMSMMENSETTRPMAMVFILT